MYRALVRRRVVANFEQGLSDGDWRSLVDQLAPDVHHAFPGDNPLGGERHTRDAVTRWFERLGRLFPGHDFHVERVVVSGWPWSTWVVVAWTAQLRPHAGVSYRNSGTHWIHIRWGNVRYFHAYLDTVLIDQACRDMVALGVEEAGAPPIAD